jgi:vacuolar-type H+-ATPase subunit D/Vma8
MNLYIKDTQNKGLFAQAQFSQVLKNVKKLSIVAVKPDTPISKALELMTENKIFTLAMQSRSNPNKFMAIFSTSDFLDYILLKMNKTLSDPSLAQTILKESVENLLSLDPEDESYRIWERDYRDTIERVNTLFDEYIIVFRSSASLKGISKISFVFCKQSFHIF